MGLRVDTAARSCSSFRAVLMMLCSWLRRQRRCSLVVSVHLRLSMTSGLTSNSSERSVLVSSCCEDGSSTFWDN